MKFDKPKFVSTSAEYQKKSGSYVVSGGVLNCTCGALKSTVKFVTEDRGSDAGGASICMDIDTKPENFSQSFGICSKTGKSCVLAQMNAKWNIPAKVPSYVVWTPPTPSRSKYTVADAGLVNSAEVFPVILESSLICWHNGTAGMVTIEKNGQGSKSFELDDNRQRQNSQEPDEFDYSTTSRMLSVNSSETGLNLNKNVYNDINLTEIEPEDITRQLARWLIANPASVYITQQGLCSDLFYWAGFVRDSNGIYHARPDCLQQAGGYTDVYDTVFYYATRMAKEKFEFSMGERKFILWAWKGDYLNLGAGAELGIYSNKSGILGQVDVTSPFSDIWFVDTGLAMPMTMTLQYQGKTIISYDPSKDKDYPYDKVWWITGFNPYYQGKKASDLTASYTIDFSQNKDIYNAFYDTWYGKDNAWTFVSKNHTATYIFQQEGIVAI